MLQSLSGPELFAVRIRVTTLASRGLLKVTEKANDTAGNLGDDDRKLYSNQYLRILS